MGFVADIIESVVDAVVDIVEAVIDLVVDIVEAVVDAVADLLGFTGEEVVEYFEVYNQPLFDATTVDFLVPKAQVASAIYNNQRIDDTLILSSIFSDNVPKSLRKFHQFIEDGNYYTDYPQVESFINFIDDTELNNVLDGIAGTPTTITFSKLGRLTIPYWVETYLRDNTSYNVNTHAIPYNYTNTFTIDSTNPAFVNTTTDTIIVASTNTLQLGDDIVYTVSAGQTEIGGLTSGTTYYATSISQPNPGYWELQLAASLPDALNVPPVPVTLTSAGTGTADTFVHSFTADRAVDYLNPAYSVSGNNYVVNYTDGAYFYTVPAKPTGTHVTADYYADNDPNSERRIFTYKLGTGTYSELDSTEPSIDISSDTLKCMPAIPLRLNNTNYNASSNTRADQINDLLALVKMDGPSILDAIFQDYTGQPSDLDHIYVNFGVRLVDTSQGALNYLFNLFDTLHLSNTVTKADYNAATGEKPYNNIIITHDDYKMVFKYAYTDYASYTVAQVNANSALSDIYYSKADHFDDNDVLLKPYFASSAQKLYNVQYKADNLTEVNQYLAGNGVTAGSYTSGGAGKLQVTTRIAYSGTIQDADGADSGHVTLKPSLVYENNGGTLRILASIDEGITSAQEISYYQIVPNGMNVYTVKAPIGALRVVDADSGKFKMVKFNLASGDDLMVPLFYGIVLDTGVTSKELSSLFLASAHVSLYIARYEVIETGGFLKILLAIIIIVVVLLVTGYIDPSTFTMMGGAGTTSTGAAVTTTTNAAGATIATNTATGTVVAQGTTITVTNSLGLAVTHTVGAAGVVSFGTVVWAPTIVAFAGQMVVNQIIQMAIMEIATEVSPELAMAIAVTIGFSTGNFQTGGATLGNTIKAGTIVVDSYSGIQTIMVNEEFDEVERTRQQNEERIKDEYAVVDEMQSIIDEITGLKKNMLNVAGMDVRGYVNPASAEGFYLNSLGTTETIPHTYNFEHIMTKTFDFNDNYRSIA